MNSFKRREYTFTMSPPHPTSGLRLVTSPPKKYSLLVNRVTLFVDIDDIYSFGTGLLISMSSILLVKISPF